MIYNKQGNIVGTLHFSHLNPPKPDGQVQLPFSHVPPFSQEKCMGQAVKKDRKYVIHYQYTKKHKYTKFILDSCRYLRRIQILSAQQIHCSPYYKH